MTAFKLGTVGAVTPLIDIKFPNPFPSIQDMMQSLLKFWTDLLFGSIENAIGAIVSMLSATTAPRLDVGWFIDLYNQVIGLLLVLGLLAILKAAFLASVREREGALLSLTAGTIRFVLILFCTPAVVGLLIYGQTLLIAGINGMGSGSTDWSNALQQPYGIPDILGSIVLRLLTLVPAAFIWLFLAIESLDIYTFTLLIAVAALAFVTDDRDSDKRAFRWATSALLAILLTRPLILAFLKVSGTIIANEEGVPETMKAAQVFFVVGICSWMPIIFFLLGTVAVTRVQNRVRVSGFVHTRSNTGSQQTRSDLDQIRRSRSAGINGATRPSVRRATGQEAVDLGLMGIAVWATKAVHPAAGAAVQGTRNIVKKTSKRP